MILNRKDWYSTDYVLFNIVTQLTKRYLSVRKNNPEKKSKSILTRYYMGHTLSLLKESLERNNALEDNSAKLYFDLATWKNSDGTLPMFSFNAKIRKEQQKKFNGNKKKQDGEYLKDMKGYDFAIDLDSKNLKIAWKDAKKIKELFDERKLPYSIRFSGSKGFHFVIDQKWIELNKKPYEMPDLFGKVVTNIAKDEFGQNKDGDPKSCIDFSIYDSRRILKLAYSLVNCDGKEYICLPLSDEQFNNFKKEDMELITFMDTREKLFQRRLLERDHNLTEKQLKENVLKFLKEYG